MLSSKHIFDFQELASLLEPYYVLVDKINAAQLLTVDDLEPFFDSSLIEDILNVQSLYASSYLKRRCDNPFFIHFFRTLVWAKALDLPLLAQRLAVYHDIFEDFSSPLDRLLELRTEIPSDLVIHLDAVTNMYHLVLKAAKKRGAKTISQLNDILPALYDDRLPKWNLAINRLLEEVSSSGLVCNPLDYFDDVCYHFYLEDLKDYVLKTGSFHLLYAKFLDRLDNTISDLPSNYTQIRSLYVKNAAMLDIMKDLIASHDDSMLDVMYFLLYDRSYSQLRFIKDQYALVSKERGSFYGKQFSKIHRSFYAQEQQMDVFTPIVKSLLEKDSVHEYVDRILHS